MNFNPFLFRGVVSNIVFIDNLLRMIDKKKGKDLTYALSLISYSLIYLE